MATYACHDCCELFDYTRRPGVRRCDPPCPGCGPGTKVSRILPERERYEDDGTGDYERGIERRREL